MNDLHISPAALSAALKGDFHNAAIAATPGGIERQEAEGQRDIAAEFRTLPKNIDRDAAEKFGFQFGSDADDIFVNVTAPAGWSIRPTEHSMHSDIIDAQGRKRGSIFYKAAFYDRRAGGNWTARYGVEADYTDDYDVVGFKAIDRATDNVLFAENVLPDGGDKYARQDAAEESVRAKLADHFPDYGDVTAYWES